MARVSKDTTESVKDLGVALDRSSTLEDYTVNFVTIREASDLAPLLAGLPGGHCSCPHWGYLLAGEMTIRYGDEVETIVPGDAFYLPPGHTPAAAAGTEFVQFSPADLLAETEAAMAAAMQAH